MLIAAPLLATTALAAGSSPRQAAPITGTGQATFEAIRALDKRLATIGFDLARANRALCDRQAPGTGLVVHALAQYDANPRAAAAHFAFAGNVAILATVDASPAADKIMPDETLVKWGDVAVADLPTATPTAPLIALYDRTAQASPTAPVQVETIRDGQARTTTLDPIPVCRTRFELEISDAVNAEADGEMVQISSRLLEEYPDSEVAVLVAHELAHNILRHRDRLDAAKVARGLLAGVGRNARLFRQTELEADILSVHLLVNAGYPPLAAATFWRKFGPDHAGGWFRSATHPGWRERAARMQQEGEAIAAGRADPKAPPILQQRTVPLDGDWRALLAAD
ncbi:M48 family metallopeptidase [Sphingomonas qomolangmaensis]|uniref:M48 family metallopeptidase n=1 Tax=Sphingomonas qomolangmaensis TaxID=2918765 RepID=A0ABY5LBB0_9SPHN|nr:M48 family metallopeptidase [Sphingomonas qomolangmaensis]UUL83009.1 M48 family metallopeptidase [Sphingomonas qomolangmaensis]